MKKKENAVVPVARATPAALIEKAVMSGADLEKLEKLLTLQERWEENEARKAYHKAMAQFKINLPEIIKDKKVAYSTDAGTVKYNYASLYNIVNKITPKLSEFGLSLSWTHKQENDRIYVTCKITHELGYSESTTMSGPADSSGKKNAIQQIGSTIAYLERYTILGLLGAATKEQDDDGKASGIAVEHINDKQLSQLCDIIDNNPKIVKKKYLEYLKVSSLEELPKADFQKALTALNNIVGKGRPE